ncbi:MAG: TfoX/Sxy family protein [Phenylobacterium sp.]
MPHDPHLADLMREALAGRSGIRETAMFGGIWWLLNGNMLCGAGTERFIFRVGRALAPEALAMPGAETLSMKTRRMEGLVAVDADACLETGLDVWIELAARCAGARPPR